GSASDYSDFQYDLLNRSTITRLGDGGASRIEYNESPGFISVAESSRVSQSSTNPPTQYDSSVNLVNLSFYDGLGRVRKTMLESDPAGPDYTRTDFDALGRTWKVWNPTRCDPDVNPSSCSGETTYGITTTQYDPLGRVTSVSAPD